jgi:hypothetical protein
MIKRAPKAMAQTAMSMSRLPVLANRLDHPPLETVRLLPAQRGRVALSCADRLKRV